MTCIDCMVVFLQFSLVTWRVRAKRALRPQACVSCRLSRSWLLRPQNSLSFGFDGSLSSNAWGSRWISRHRRFRLPGRRQTIGWKRPTMPRCSIYRRIVPHWSQPYNLGHSFIQMGGSLRDRHDEITGHAVSGSVINSHRLNNKHSRASFDIKLPHERLIQDGWRRIDLKNLNCFYNVEEVNLQKKAPLPERVVDAWHSCELYFLFSVTPKCTRHINSAPKWCHVGMLVKTKDVQRCSSRFWWNGTPHYLHINNHNCMFIGSQLTSYVGTARSRQFFLLLAEQIFISSRRFSMIFSSLWTSYWTNRRALLPAGHSSPSRWLASSSCWSSSSSVSSSFS